MLSDNLLRMQKKVKKELDDARYMHTLGVMYTAASLAMSCGEDMERAMTAGLLHDCAKCIPNQKKIDLCRMYGIPITDIELMNPHLLHAKLGARIAKEEYKVTDQGILNAIAFHTTGKPEMTKLEKIIFLADYIEPGREKAPHLMQIRKTAFSDLDMAVYMTLKDTLQYLKKDEASLDPQTEEAYNYYRELIEDKKEEN